MSTTTRDVDIVEPQTSHSSNLELCSNFGTGNPFHQFIVPVIEKESDLPYITEVFSLCCKESLESGKRCDSICKLESLNVRPSNFKIVESSAKVSPTIASPALNNLCTWVETCMNANNLFGLDALTLAKQNEVGVALTQYSHKLSELEETLPKMDQIIEEAEAVIDQKMARVNVLEKELSLVKRDAFAKMKSMEELRWKKELLCEETKRLKRKVDYCQEKQNQFVSHCKKVRLS